MSAMQHITAVPAPMVTRDQVAYVRNNTDAVVVQNLATGDVYLHVDPTVDPYDRIDLIVVLTNDEVLFHAKANRTVKKIADAVNADLLAMHARGEFPTIDEVENVVAEMMQIDADAADADVFPLDFFREVN
jgi:hypothetical protein